MDAYRDRSRCRAMVRPPGVWGRERQCSRFAIQDGYCRQHHPDAVNNRMEAGRRQLRERQQQKRLERRRVVVAELLRDIRDDICPGCRDLIADWAKSPVEPD